MILYKNDAKGFREAVDNNRIVDDLEQAFLNTVGHTVSPAEKNSWNNSLQFMERIVRLGKLADDCGILLEYNIPSTSKRIDFLVGGHDKEGHENFVIVELKQWSTAEATDMENLVVTFVGGADREVTHPAYQAYSYKRFMLDMSTAVTDGGLTPYSCAYLHNYTRRTPEPLLSGQYAAVCEDTPVFLKDDSKGLQDFLYEHVGQGKGMDIVETIENGKTKPARKFIDYVDDIFKGNKVFTMLDEQQVAFAQIMKQAADAKHRVTIIVNGGPGTGKSVVAMNAFVELLKLGKNVRFVAPNAAFRSAMVDMLARHKTESKKRLGEIFSGSASYCELPTGAFDILIVDEAHRLKQHGAFMYRGESQVDDVIRTSKVNVFFVDDNQQIRPDDEGSVDLIKRTAAHHKSKVIEVKLKAQFRCSGAEGYINWVDHTFQIQDTGNFDGWDQEAFEFHLMDTPQEVEKFVQEKHAQGCRARVLAGYAWPWTAANKGNPDAEVSDVQISEHGYSRPWNSRKYQTDWAIEESCQDQIGCVHTSQGLEFDYVGVLIGRDMQYDTESKIVYGDYGNYYDSTGKKGLKEEPEQLTNYIKQIYKILLTRGMKGCAVYCCDKKLQDYIKSRM